MIMFTPNPRFRFLGRDGSPSDEAVIRETWVENVYQIHPGDLRDTGILVDLGANIGSVAVYGASLGATVHAYEPEPENRALLQQNLTDNGVADRVHVHAAAVTDWLGTATITPAHGNSRINHDHSGVTVESITLAQVFEDNGLAGCDVLKMDVEGSEYEIIASADLSTLAKIRYLTMEFDAAPDQTAFGDMVTKIAKVFNTHIIGSPERGGYIYGRRY
ncbi:FkbM family methyltransferase [Nocardia testacea]|uniref:FkbM family methyltransferase n=1 Tax=Nocardia testacea TaxID=248551 RepID=UPI003C2B9A5D